MNQTKLLAALQTPTYSGMDDATAATALSVGVSVPRTGLLTITTLNQSNCWGFAKTTANLAAFNGLLAVGQTQGATQAEQEMAAQLGNLLAILTGPGLDLSDPQVPEVIATLVGAGVVSSGDAAIVTSITTYPCDTAVQNSDVTTARQVIAGNSKAAALLGQITRASAAQRALVVTYQAAILANPATAIAPAGSALQAAGNAIVVG